jgi:hypothetical protein
MPHWLQRDDYMGRVSADGKEWINGPAVIARDDEGDGSYTRGWAAVVKGDHAGLIHVAHCSCYGTWSQAGTEGAPLDWEGTPDELVSMALRSADPDMPSRMISPEDHDATHLLKLYQDVVEWFKQQK